MEYRLIFFGLCGFSSAIFAVKSFYRKVRKGKSAEHAKEISNNALPWLRAGPQSVSPRL
jgi:hypothetical protein